MHEYMEEVVNFVVTLLRLLVVTLIGSVKALLPMGVLPRKSVSGDICLITGAGSGIGRLMAIQFAKEGCTLVLWDVNEQGNNETKELLNKSGAKVYTYTVDLSDRHQINATAEKVKKEVGNVDILVNNAGIVTGKKIFECPDEMMEKTMAVNTNACLFTAKNFVKSMIERNHGHIVTVASLAGKAGTAGLVDYCASKHGAVGFHDSLNCELRMLKANGVKTTLVCPWYINTGMFDGVETKSPTILPLLEPEYVVDCVMEAVLTNKEEIQIPRFMYTSIAFAHILPTEAKLIAAEYFGIFETMDHFKGRKGIKST